MNNKLKVLLITPFYPFPEYANGVNKINVNLLLENDIYNMDILSLVSKDDKKFHDNENKFKNSKFYKIDFMHENKYLLLTKWLLGKLPFNLTKYEKIHQKVIDSINSLENNYDVIHISTPHLLPIIDKLSTNILEKIILFPIDSFTLFTQRRMEQEKNILKKVLYQIDYNRLKKVELNIYSKLNKVYFVSDTDANFVNNFNDSLKTQYIPNGVDIDYFIRNESIEIKSNSLIFTGNMSYAPNKDACEFLINDILPILIKKIPDIRLYIVGINADKEFKNVKSDNIIIKGFVEDIREYISQASIYISPLRFGSGIKNKILEAMSMSKIVIGTDISFESIKGIDNSYIKTSIDKNEFANSIIKILKNPDYKIGENARELILEKYSWKYIQKQYGKVYENCINNK